MGGTKLKIKGPGPGDRSRPAHGGKGAPSSGGKGAPSSGGKGAPHPKRKKQGTATPKGFQEDVALPDVGGNSEEEEEVSDEDIEFVQQHGAQLGFLTSLDKAALDKSLKAKANKEAQASKAKPKVDNDDDGDEDEDDSDDDEDGSDDGDDDDAGGNGDDEDGGGMDDDEDGAEAYEKAPRRTAKEDAKGPKHTGLPVKTLEGEILFEAQKAAKGAKPGASQVPRVFVPGITIEDDMEYELKHKAEAQAIAEEEATQKRVKEALEEKLRKKRERAETSLPPALRALQYQEDIQKRRQQLMEVMATSAQKLLTGPEDNVSELRTLNVLCADKDLGVSRLAMVSALAVYRDILPGYRVRPPTEKEQEVKLSKEVQKLRDYEQTLLKAYQSFMRQLLSAADCVKAEKGPVQHSRVAIRCMCELLVAVPHFNYTSDLLQAIVPRMVSGDEEIRSHTCEAVKQLLAIELDSSVPLEAVQLVADLIKRRKCLTHPDVVSCLSVLRFSEIKPVNVDDKNKKHIGKKAQQKAKKKANKDLLKEVDKDFKEADAGPDVKAQTLMQSQMLEALFEIYFRVLKLCTASGMASASLEDQRHAASSSSAGEAAEKGRCAHGLGWSNDRLRKKFPLLAPTLEGLARYTHLISVNYYNDLMEVFRQMLGAPALPLPERLRVLLTAATILKGQASQLNIDQREFYMRLYEALELVPFRSLNGGGLGDGLRPDGTIDTSIDTPSDNGDKESDDAPTTGFLAKVLDGSPIATILGQVMQYMICDPKVTDVGRMAAFAKRVSTVALAAPAGGETLALLGAVLRLMRRYPRLLNMLTFEGDAPVGGRSFSADCRDPSESGALATTLWELSQLVRHYHPHVAKAASSLLQLASGPQASANLTGPLSMAGTLKELGAAYDSSSGRYNPAPPKPSRRPGQSQTKGRHGPALSPSCMQLLQECGEAGPADSSSGGSDDRKLTSSILDRPVAEEELMHMGAAFKKHFSVATRFERNARLRKEKTWLVGCLKQFNIHLQTKKMKKKA